MSERYHFPKTEEEIEALCDRLRAFLSTPSFSDGGGWAPASNDDLTEFRYILDEIVEAKWQRDCDGDLSVQVMTTDRNRYEGIPCVLVPYLSKGLFDEPTRQQVVNHVLARLTNAQIATDHLRTTIELLRSGYLDKALAAENEG